MIEQFLIVSEAKGRRVDQYLASVMSERLSRMKVKELILEGKVLVDGKPVKPNFTLFPDQLVQIDFEPAAEKLTRAEKIPIEIIFEDKDLIVINKPAGMVVHPACGNASGTLVNALLYHTKSLSKVGGDIRSGIVHRLDKDTSGVMVVAKNDKAHKNLAHQFKNHQVEKIYWAVVKGIMHHDEMKSNQPLGRSPYDRRKVIARNDEEGRDSLTNFRVLRRFKNASLVEACPQTGRTHQIRVHLKHLGYPVLGDSVYGIMTPLIGRQALHAKSISFLHPTTGKKIFFESDVPKDFKKLLKVLE